MDSNKLLNKILQKFSDCRDGSLPEDIKIDSLHLSLYKSLRECALIIYFYILGSLCNIAMLSEGIKDWENTQTNNLINIL